MKVVFRRVPFDRAMRDELTVLINSCGHEAVWLPDNPPPTAEMLFDADILMGYFPTDILNALTNLKWLQTPAAGVDRLCGEIDANSSVILTNCSGAFGVAIAEYMLTGLLMLMRNMPAYAKKQEKRIWQEDKLCRSIYGSTITVVGMGDIGTKFAIRAKALGAHIRGVRRTLSAPDGIFDEVYETKDLITAVKNADAVVLCLPATNETKGLISEKILAAMSGKTILVNCGRGVTVDEKALTDALLNRQIAGAVLDVFEIEPLSDSSPLWDMENVIITPHISGHDTDPVNAVEIFRIFKENLTLYFSGKKPNHIVDRKRGY